MGPNSKRRKHLKHASKGNGIVLRAHYSTRDTQMISILLDPNIFAAAQVQAPIVSDKTCQERVCNVGLGPVKLQNCIIADNHICAGGLSGKGPCRVRQFNNKTQKQKNFNQIMQNIFWKVCSDKRSFTHNPHRN